MIVDCHTHIFEAGRGGPFNFPAGAEDLMRLMDEHGIDMSVVLPLPGVASNEFVYRECERFGDRLAPLYTPEFDAPGETVARMEAFFERFSPKGLKIHPRWQNVTVEDTPVLDVLGWAADRDVPVLFDVFAFGPSLGKMATYPIAYHNVAQKLPKLRMVLAHSGGYRVMEAFLVAKSNAGVHLDISFTPVYFKGSSVASDCGFLCQSLPAGRVLYGSDFPYIRVPDSLEAASRICACLDENARREVMGDAAARFFRLGKR
jgi:predicted TIM-barrel fold metal-dependent hydrolase